MFDIAFTELMIAAVIALIVVGPQRLPKMARQIGAWIGKLQRYVNDVKSDINRQIQLDELRDLKSEVTDAARSLESSMKETIESTQKDFDEISTSMSGNLLDDDVADSPASNWEKVYQNRRLREKIRDRRDARTERLGKKRPRRKY
ncbi:MAG: Sec-independent protein translocase protein TatB [Burkholderiaceae bacterium]